MNTMNSNVNSNIGTTANRMNSPMNQNIGSTNINTTNSNFNQNMNGNASTWNGAQPNYHPAPKNDNMKYIIIGVAVVVFVFIVIAASLMLFGNKTNSDSSYSGSGSEVSKSSTYKVKIDGYTVEVPDTYIYEEVNGELLIGDEASTWLARMGFDQGNFSQIKANKDKLQTVFQKDFGVTVSGGVEKTIGGVESLVFYFYDGGQKYLLALPQIDTNHYGIVIGQSADGQASTEILEHIAPVLRSVKYTGELNHMQAPSKLDIKALSEAIK